MLLAADALQGGQLPVVFRVRGSILDRVLILRGCTVLVVAVRLEDLVDQRASAEGLGLGASALADLPVVGLAGRGHGGRIPPRRRLKIARQRRLGSLRAHGRSRLAHDGLLFEINFLYRLVRDREAAGHSILVVWLLFGLLSHYLLSSVLVEELAEHVGFGCGDLGGLDGYHRWPRRDE